MRSTLLLLVSLNLLAQEKTTIDSVKSATSVWKHRLIGSLSVTQGSYSNWTQGGENSLAWVSSFDGRTLLDLEKTDWSITYKLAFGQAQLGDQGVRKTEDRIDLQTVLTYKIGSMVNPYFAATLKTQFTTGFQYDKSGRATAVSQFFDPAYLTQSVGFGYQPLKELKFRLGYAVREIVTSVFTAYSDDPKTPEVERTKVERGAESVTELEIRFDENVFFRSKLELFSSLRSPAQIVIRGDNTLTIKLGKIVTINANLQLINEPPVTARTQVRQSVGIGVSYSFL